MHSAKVILFLSLFLVLSVGLNVVQYVCETSQPHSPATYVFFWHNEYIKNGTLTMTVTMDWQPDKLVMKVVVDDDDGGIGGVAGADYLGVAFDTDNNKIFLGDYTFGLMDNNKAYWRPGTVVLTKAGCLGFASVLPEPSPFHNCTFTEGKGYTFDIVFPKSSIANVNPPVPVHLVFYDTLAKSKSKTDVFVWVEFLG